MSVVLFVREDLLKATHKELKWIESFTDKHGHVHRGHHKHVLVADDHDNTKVATGQGSFYQKAAHKNALADIPNFQSLDIDHQANIILHHATKLQQAASASAALSGFKSAMLDGKVPTTAQYLAMVNAPSNAQGKVVDACVAVIGEEKYTQLLLAASAKANQPKGKTSESKAPQAVQTSQKEQALAAPAAEPAKPAAPAQAGVAAQAAVEATAGVKDGPKAPTPPKFKDLSHGMVASQWGKMFESGDHQALKDSLSKFAGNMQANPSLGNDPDTLALMKYALAVGSALPGPAGPKEGDTKPGMDGKSLVFKNGRWHKYVDADESGEVPPVLVPVDDDFANHKAAVAAMEGGAYYQKEAVKKLKAEHGPAWDAMHPSKQLDLAHAKYQALQGAASQSAAVSGWKKHMLAGQTPTPSEVKAMAAFDASTPDKALKVMNDVKAAIGMDAYIQLVTQAHAKAAKAPAAVAAKPPEPAKVFVTTPPVAVTTPSPVKVDPPAPPVNEAMAKLSTPLQNLVTVFDLEGGSASTLSVDNNLIASEAAAFMAATPDEKSNVAAAISFYGPHKLKLFMDWVGAQNAKAAAPAAPAAPIPVTSNVYTNTQPGHNKFWSVSVHGSQMKTSYGKIGTQGSTTTKDFASHAAAAVAAFKLKNEKLSKGYAYSHTGKHEYEGAAAGAPAAVNPPLPPTTTSAAAVAAAAKPAGPKDGDTKLGVDGGALVFKNGRWHKVVVKKLKPMEIKALIATKFGSPLSTNDASKKAKIAAGLGDASGMVAAYNDAVACSWPTTAKKIKLIAEAMGVSVNGTPVASAASSATAAPVAPSAQPVKTTVSAPKVKVAPGKPPVTVIDGWAQTGPQKGSNPGGKFKDKSGQEWYCKFPADVDVAMNELLAAKFYQMLGVSVPSLKLVEQGGKVGIASKWVDGISKGTADQLAKAPGAHQAFALDAWLANWDVVGMANDNLMLDKSGAAVRVDVGGSLVYRAMGGVKGDAFGDTVPELDTLKDAKKNDKSAAVFGGVKDADMAWGLGQLNKLKPSQIEELCQKAGPGSEADKAALAKKLIARRAFILAKMGVRDQWTHVKVLNPTKLPVNPVDLPKPIQFKASSKAHVNAQNTKDSEALISFAAKGNLTALKDYLYDAVDKETSAPLGKKSILDHPSKPLKEQWAGLVELLQSISTPPMPTLELPSLGSIGDLEDISAFVGTFSPQERVETVAAEHRMHFFMALSHIDDISGLVADIKWSFLKTGSKFVQAAKAKHSSLSTAVKGYIKSVQSSGYINHSWSQGKTTVESGGKLVGIHGLTAKIYAEAQEIPEGTTLIRGMSDTSSGKSMCSQLLACAPGTVIQNTDSMCASYNESHSWGGDVQMTIRCAKGCKATLSFATGKYGGEHEITTLPGQRYVVLSTKKVDKTVHLEVLMLPPHEGFVSELANLSALGKAMSVIFVRGR